MLHHQRANLSLYRQQTLLKCLAFVSCLCGLLCPGDVLAQEALHLPESSATGCAAGVQERFLRVEPKFVFMMHVGNKLTQNGKVLDPGFFSIIPDFAVNGSKTAKEHLSHARIAHGAALAAFLTTAGLLVGAEVIRQQHDDRWTNPSTAMALSSVVTFLFSVGLAHWRDWETFATVNSYNHDLVSGQLDY